mgnify:CR=1 FL=1
MDKAIQNIFEEEEKESFSYEQRVLQVNFYPTNAFGS